MEFEADIEKVYHYKVFIEAENEAKAREQIEIGNWDSEEEQFDHDINIDNVDEIEEAK